MIGHLLANGWLLGKPENYNRKLALYPEDLLGFVQETQDAQWQKFRALYPNNPEAKFLERVSTQLNKADPNAANKEMRTLNNAQPIIIVTLQTFPHVLKAIENSVSLKERRYAIIADEAHSSQTGSTARQFY